MAGTSPAMTGVVSVHMRFPCLKGGEGEVKKGEGFRSSPPPTEPQRADGSRDLLAAADEGELGRDGRQGRGHLRRGFELEIRRRANLC
jgi:hypothetical protein